MCHPASFVLTKDSVFWSMKTDSHEDIIREFELSQDGLRGPNILRVELTPPKMIDYGAPAKKWNYKLDQDILPEWHDAKADEARARLSLVEWIDKRVIRKGAKRECRYGLFFAVANSQVTAVGDSQVTAWDNSQVRQYAGSVAAPRDFAVVIDRRNGKPVCITAVVDIERTK